MNRGLWAFRIFLMGWAGALAPPRRRVGAKRGLERAEHSRAAGGECGARADVGSIAYAGADLCAAGGG